MKNASPKVITKSDPARIEIEWVDGHRTRYSASELRRLCPCARCVNELTGERMLDAATITDTMTQADCALVGNYALTMRFSDGHHTGIFPFKFLRDHDPAGG